MHADFLFIIAEIAAAFAGFASLVAAISTRKDRSPEQEELDFLTLRNVLFLSLMAIFFALLPNLLERQIEDAHVAWRLSAAAYLVVVGAYLVYTIRLLTGAYRGVGRSAPLTFFLNGGVVAAAVVAQALTAADAAAAATYLLGLAALVYNAGFGFVRLFVSLRPQRRID